MNIKLILLCFFLNFLYPIGLRALVIPQTASLLSQSGAGISNSFQVNPALLLNANNGVSFSRNTWLGGITGQKMSLLSKNNTYISFETLSVSDIELRDEIASDSPIGFFGAYWYALELNRAVSLDDNFSLGYKIKMNLSKLYTETMNGYTLDVGINKLINNNFSIGFLIKNLGKEYSDNLNASNTISYGLGINYNIDDYKIILISDLLNQNNENLLKVALKTNLSLPINFVFGSTYSDNYKDFSMGVILNLKGWLLVYGNLNHNNPILGNPSSFEIKKYF